MSLSHRYELYGASAIVVVDKHGTIHVRIMNPTSKPIRLYRYSTLGTFEAEDKEVMAVDLEETGYPPENPHPSCEELKDAIDLSKADLTTDQRQRLLVLLSSYRDVFAMTSKELGRTSEVMHVIDTGDARPFRLRAYRTFQIWHKSMTKAADKANCRFNSLLEFMSHFTLLSNRAITAVLRLNENQEMVSQITHLSNKELVGLSHFPYFVEQQLTNVLSETKSLRLSSKILSEGFPLLINPIVDIEHNGDQLDLSILVTVPELTNTNAICSVEYLSPVKYNISGTCETGPILTDNLLALITCADTKAVVRADSLAKCHQQDDSLLCPHHTIQPVRDLEWLGLPWTAESHMAFPRHHQKAEDCSHLIPVLHLGGRAFLSTTSGVLQLNPTPIQLAPLTIFHLPCNVSFPGMPTGLSECPKRLEISVPLVLPDFIKYVPWNSATHQT